MTESTDTTAVVDADDVTGTAAPDDTAADTEAVSDDDSDDDSATDDATDAGANAEAARWRVKLRATEAERDRLAERLAGYQRAECESAVADLLDVPGDLWEVGGADVSAFYDDDGTLNDAELRAAAGALVDQRPRLAKPAEQPRLLNWGQVSAGNAPPGGGMSWSDVINPR